MESASSWKNFSNPLQAFPRSCYRPPLPPGFKASLRLLNTDAQPRHPRFLSNDLHNWYWTEQNRLDPRDVPGQDAPSKLKTFMTPGIQDRTTTWSCVKQLGNGSFGTASLWENINPPSDLPCQLVLKQGQFNNFFQDYNNEAVIALRLWRLGCFNVPEVYEWKSVRDQAIESGGVNMIASEYCEHGTLGDLMRFYQLTLNIPFPEPFIWHVFHSLARVLTYCERGTLAGTPLEDFDHILHYDLKPDNIFLADPTSSDNPHYPTIKVGDWGLAYSIPRGVLGKDMNTYKAQFHGGTRGFHPPVCTAIGREHDFRNQLYPTTMQSGPEKDMWTVGKIIHRMMTLGTSGTKQNSQTYTQRLQMICQLAMDGRPAKRIMPYSLYLETKLITEDYCEQLDIIKSATSYSGPNSYYCFYAGYVLYREIHQMNIVAHDNIRQTFNRFNTRDHPFPPELQKMAADANTLYHKSFNPNIPKKVPRDPVGLKQVGDHVYIYRPRTGPERALHTDSITDENYIDCKPWGPMATIDLTRSIEVATAAISTPFQHEPGDSEKSDGEIMYSEYIRHLFATMDIESNEAMTTLAAATSTHPLPLPPPHVLQGILNRSSNQATPMEPGLHSENSPLPIQSNLLQPTRPTGPRPGPLIVQSSRLSRDAQKDPFSYEMEDVQPDQAQAQVQQQQQQPSPLSRVHFAPPPSQPPERLRNATASRRNPSGIPNPLSSPLMRSNRVKRQRRHYENVDEEEEVAVEAETEPENELEDTIMDTSGHEREQEGLSESEQPTILTFHPGAHFHPLRRAKREPPASQASQQVAERPAPDFK